MIVAAGGFLLLAVSLPIIAALLLAVPSLRRRVVASVPWMALPALGLALAVEPGTVADLPWLLLGSRLGIDDTGRVFLLFTGALWLVCGQYARARLARDPAQHRFCAFFLASMAGNLGVVLAADIVTFYFFFALMSFASYGLVIHAGDPESLRAGRVYMVFVVAGEVLLFAGIIGIAGLGGDGSFRAMNEIVGRSSSGTLLLAFVLAGFAIKTAAVPLHVWLPLAYRSAPSPASAALSGPMIKAGLLGWLRFLPLGVATLPAVGAACVVGGFVSAFWGVCVGLTQKDPKTVLGYSSISQMGLITTGVGAGLLAPASWPLILPAITLYAFHHAAAKSALFLGADIASRVAAGTPRRGLVAAGLVVPAVALAGAPLTSGAVAKVALKKSLEEAPLSSGMVEFLLAAAAAGTTMLMVRFLVVVRAPKGPVADPLPAGAWIPWLVAVAGVGLSVWSVPWMGFQDAALESLAPTHLWTTAWPTALGAAIAWWVWRRPQSIGRASTLQIPAGDILTPLARILDHVRPSADRLGRLISLAVSSAPRRERVGLEGSLYRGATRLEARLQQWDVVGLLALGIAAVLFALLSGSTAG